VESETDFSAAVITNLESCDLVRKVSTRDDSRPIEEAQRQPAGKEAVVEMKSGYI
jgi:hypothetical protein